MEIGSRSLREPFTIKEIISFIGESYPDMPFADTPIDVPIVNPERTFLEKVFLLHEEFQRPPNKMRVNRLSRHLYDIEKLMDTEFGLKALENEKLYNDLIRHRKIFTKVGEIDYNLHQPLTIDPIPPDEVRDAWKKDYQVMRDEMIYGGSLSYEELIARIEELKLRINTVNWEDQ